MWKTQPLHESSMHSIGVRAKRLRRLGTWYQVFQVKTEGKNQAQELKPHPREMVRGGEGEEGQL